jgi:hypothetical protein
MRAASFKRWLGCAPQVIAEILPRTELGEARLQALRMAGRTLPPRALLRSALRMTSNLMHEFSR